MSDWRQLQYDLIAQGFTVEKVDGSKWKVVPPNPEFHLVWVSPQGHPRAFRNVVAELKRVGYREKNDPPPSKRAPRPSELPDDSNGAAAEVYDTTAPPPVTLDTSAMDKAWANLKEARMYLALVEEDTRAARADFERAQGELNKREAERQRAASAMTLARREFDKLFAAADEARP